CAVPDSASIVDRLSPFKGHATRTTLAKRPRYANNLGQKATLREQPSTSSRNNFCYHSFPNTTSY
ncbi:hypothetical protein, partial [Moorena bouillonii]|uniref:hypothetical protein n=1 Tax=Moorena bouillonii TaxID=207920 RepID=UPI001BE0F47F